MTNITIITSPLLNLHITSSISSLFTDNRFDKSLTIGELKARLELITGASSKSMTIEVFNNKDQPVCHLSNDEALLGSFPIEDNYRLHVSDLSKQAGEFDDLSKVQKFELSQEQYDKKQDSVRAFLKRNKLGKYNAEEQARILKKKEEEDKLDEEKAMTIKVGDRCQARVQGEPTRRGIVKFVGKTEFKSGWWIGVQYDEPLGKNDGCVNGKRYFEAPMKYGGFVRPENVEVGNFPEIEDDVDEI